MNSGSANRRMSVQVVSQSTPVQRERPKHNSAPPSAMRRVNTSAALGGDRKGSHSSSAASSANESRRRSASRFMLLFLESGTSPSCSDDVYVFVGNSSLNF